MVFSNCTMRILSIAIVFCISFYKFTFATDKPYENYAKPEYLENLLNTEAYDKFAKFFHIPNTDLVNASERKTTLEDLFIYTGLDLGDILPRPGQLSNPSNHYDFNGMITLSRKKWRNGIVPYYISKSYKDNETSLIENTIQYNNQVLGPNIHFRPYEDKDREYVFIFSGGCGCYSNLGNVGGVQVISMVSPCLIQGYITHELEHTLGFGHQFNRVDRDDYLGVRHENIPEVLKSQYVRYTIDQPANIGQFDYYSVMFYPTFVPGQGNITAFDVKQDGIDKSRLGFEQFLSPGDIERAKTLYPV